MLFFILKVERLSFPTIYDTQQKKKDAFFLIDLQHWEFTGPKFLNQDGVSLFSIFFLY